jgi:hypothetical protein
MEIIFNALYQVDCKGEASSTAHFSFMNMHLLPDDGQKNNQNVSYHTINPLINGLSDHSTQLIRLEHVNAPIQEFTSCYVRIINSFTINALQSTVSTEKIFLNDLIQMLYLTTF